MKILKEECIPWIEKWVCVMLTPHSIQVSSFTSGSGEEAHLPVTPVAPGEVWRAHSPQTCLFFFALWIFYGRQRKTREEFTRTAHFVPSFRIEWPAWDGNEDEQKREREWEDIPWLSAPLFFFVSFLRLTRRAMNKGIPFGLLVEIIWPRFSTSSQMFVFNFVCLP